MERGNLSSRAAAGQWRGLPAAGRESELPKWLKPRGPSSDAGHRGGPLRSSDQARDSGVVVNLRPAVGQGGRGTEKGGRGGRVLGVPTVADRVAQTVVYLCLEPEVEPVFHPDSYRYRPGRSAHDAIGRCRRRCWRYDGVLDLDLKSFFDSLDHSLVLKAVAHHTDLRWIL